jgi:hypothetical protein
MRPVAVFHNKQRGQWVNLLRRITKQGNQSSSCRTGAYTGQAMPK